MIVAALLSIEGRALFVGVTYSVGLLILQLGVLRRLAAVCDVLWRLAADYCLMHFAVRILYFC